MAPLVSVEEEKNCMNAFTLGSLANVVPQKDNTFVYASLEEPKNTQKTE